MKARTPVQKARNRRIAMMLLCFIMGAVVLVAFVGYGGSGYDASTEAKAFVLQNHVSQTGAENAVTAVYLNYRLWDTLFEAMLLLLSAIAVISFSWSMDNEG